MKRSKVTINGTEWAVRRIPHEQFDPGASDSMCYVDNKSKMITFAEEEFSFGAVVHETFHAYCKSLYLNSTHIDWREYEEIIAEMLEEKLLSIAETANKIYKALK